MKDEILEIEPKWYLLRKTNVFAKKLIPLSERRLVVYEYKNQKVYIERSQNQKEDRY